MGRLPFVSLALAAASPLLAFCNDQAKPDPQTRSESIVSSASAPLAATSAPSVATHDVAPPRGPLCDRSVEGRALPKSAPALVDASGHVSDATLPALDGKRARWVSFFASWCGPCKEEIPRITRFAKQLERDGIPVDVEFVSIDDDLRQLTAFFGAQPDGGLKSSFWLRDGAPRAAWMTSLKMKSDPPLPEHAIFDGKGRLKCFVSGAVEEGDYAQLVSSLR